ncbi:MAG: DUF4080 domain-containing protein [Eubacterium sp.]|nr:DUF4080 domain-containing protein [Eubacterium sp.]
MKILLVALNAKYIHSNPAIYSLKAYALKKLELKKEDSIEIAEFTINDRYEDIIAGIIERHPDMIGFSTYIWNSDMMKRVMKDIRLIDPAIKLFCGGPEATNDPLCFLDLTDMVLLGEGEKTFTLVADSFFNGKEIQEEEWEGILTRDHIGNIIPSEMSQSEMDQIPFLYDKLEEFDNRIIYYESSRGCPFRCSYCLSSLDRHVRVRNMDVVLQELKYFLDKKVKQVKFIDRTFNFSKERSLLIWSFLKENDNGITNFHFEIGADLLSDEEIELLSSLRTGLVQLEIGIQTTNVDTMREIRRVADNDKILDNVRRLRKNYNINIHTDLIAGLPLENYESFKRSFNDIYPLYADQLQLGFLKVLKGTYMHQKKDDYKLVYMDHQPYEVFSTKWLSYEENLKLHKIADAVELFYNSQLFRNSLKYMERWFESPFDMYEALAAFLDERNLSHIGINARKKYEILTEFALDKFKEIKNSSDTDDNKTEDDLKEREIKDIIRFDEMLHMHPNRKMTADDYFFIDGKERHIEFDYENKNVVTKEVSWKEI